MPTPPYQPPFTLIHLEGRTTVFESIEALYRDWRDRAYFVARFHVETRRVGGGRYEPFTNDWIVRDNLGQIVTDAYLESLRPRYPKVIRKGHLERVLHAERLGLPIPYTRCRRGGGHYFRRIRTTATNRARACAASDERDVLKISGRIKQLPTSWDDVPRELQRSWKKHRRTQWKPT